MVNLAELDDKTRVLMVFKLLLDILQYKRHGYKKEVNINKF
jgi:hypothetical protein